MTASGARSEPKASEVHRTASGARSEPKASEVHRARRTAIAAAILLAALAAPELAAACPMCLAGQGGGTGKAFAIGSIFLSITPLTVIGAAVWYLRRRARALGAAEQAPAASSPPLSRSSSSR